MTLTPFQLAIEAIDMFIEYRDKHGYDESRARTAAALEVGEGTAQIRDTQRREILDNLVQAEIEEGLYDREPPAQE